MPKLSDIAKFINGTLRGNSHAVIDSVNSIESASQNEISFLTSEKYQVNTIKAGALIVRHGYKLDYPNLIFVHNPYQAFSLLLEYFFPRQIIGKGIHPAAAVNEKAKIAENVKIGPFVTVGENAEIGENTEIHAGVQIYHDTKIGRNCLVYANVVIRERVEIGDNVIIHAGAVIGADGFGFQRDEKGVPFKIPQKGRVRIGNDCEIGANTCIDRSTIQDTVLEDCVKLDNLVQIGHNVTVGQGTFISAQTGISGSTQIGRNVTMGGQVGLADHIQIGDNVLIAAQSGVTNDVSDNKIVAGTPHQPITAWRRSSVIFRNLDQYVERIKKLEKKNKKE